MQCVIQEKLDGLSISLEYRDGKLFQMLTRGDGKVGEDITPNAEHIPSIPKEISEKGVVCIRGEALIRLNDFKDHLADKFENPRNTASGLIRGKSTVQYLKHITFVAYDYYGPLRGKGVDTEDRVQAYLGSLGFSTPKLCHTVNNPEEAIAVYEQYDKEWRDDLPWLTDGLVLKVNSLALQNKLGANNSRPEHSVAIKPTPKACITTVLSITWEMGLSGRYTPVVQVTPTPLDGVTLRNVNMHNLDYLGEWVKKGFGIGAQVTVVRSGDVIPYLTGVLIPAA